MPPRGSRTDDERAVEAALGIRLTWEPVGRRGDGREVLRCRADDGQDETDVVFVKFESAEEVMRHGLATRLLSEVGLPVPEVIALQTNGGRGFSVTRQVQGISLDDALARGMKVDDALEHAGVLLGRMHSISFQSHGWFDPAEYPAATVRHGARLDELRRSPWGLDYLVEHGSISGPIAREIRLRSEENIDLFEGPSVFVHGDFRPPHLFVDPSGSKVTGLIDFGDVRSDHPVWDLVWIRLFRPELLDPILRSYPGAITDLDRRLQLLGLQRLVGEVAWLLQNEFPVEDDRLERIHLYLGALRT